jgi:hypothetical protein
MNFVINTVNELVEDYSNFLLCSGSHIVGQDECAGSKSQGDCLRRTTGKMMANMQKNGAGI